MAMIKHAIDESENDSSTVKYAGDAVNLGGWDTIGSGPVGVRLESLRGSLENQSSQLL